MDAISFEVIRHKLWSICQEQAITLRSVSGSSVVTQSADFNNGLYLPDGSIVIFGSQVLVHAGNMSIVLRSVIRDCSKDPGIEDGDMFVVNDPYKGAVHLNDVSIMAPYFHKGEIIAWFGSCAHQLDVGGMEASSWCPKASERFQEGLIITPLKIVQKGEVRKDLLNMLLANSRLPFLLGLDIHALIASNNVAKKRFSAIVDRFGAGAVLEAMHTLLDRSEKKLRQKLLELPDGIFRAVDFLDEPYYGKLYKVMVTLAKEKDTLSFDFTGSSPQAPNAVNCAESNTAGHVISEVLSSLAYDISWNEGIKRTLKINAPLGTVCNARFPAPTSLAPAAIGQKVSNAVAASISKLLACSQKYGHESGGLTSTSWIGLNLAGRNQYGEPFGIMFLDTCGGSGAHRGKDGHGLLASGNVVKILSNIESNENIAPVLYLYRRHLQDSSGAGEFRGARSLGLALTPHDTDVLAYILVCYGEQVPSAAGLLGGFPGSCNIAVFMKNSNILQRQKEGKLPFRAEELHREIKGPAVLPERCPIRPGDVLEFSQQGGGGYGSPLDREPQKVLHDFLKNEISTEFARSYYKVAINPENREIDCTETGSLRQKYHRVNNSPANPLASIKNSSLRKTGQIGNYIDIVNDGSQTRISCKCGCVLSKIEENWKKGAVLTSIPSDSLGPYIKLHESLEVRQYSCPACGRWHSIELSLKNEPPLWDFEIKKI